MLQVRHVIITLICLFGINAIGCGPRQVWTVPTNLKHLIRYNMGRQLECRYSTSTQPVDLEIVIFVVNKNKYEYPILTTRSEFHAPKDVVEAHKSISDLRFHITPNKGESSKFLVPIDDSITSFVLCIREGKIGVPQDQSIKWSYFEFKLTPDNFVQIPNVAALPLLESNSNYSAHFAKLSDAETERKAEVEGLMINKN
ncbi:MAG: hypothetical protein JNJ77_11170 [Planctomycetia bacterium]|nr:hypothetical protein [Planctomycetia bacterium]